MNDENINNPLQPRPFWRQFLKTPEGIILLLGIALTLTGLFVLGMVAYWSFSTSRMMGAMAFTALVFGSAVSMSLGYAAGYGYAFVVSVNMWMDTVLVLLFYPVFVLSLRKLLVFPKLAHLLDSIDAAAERHQDKVHRFGIFGLFIFVWIPFWMTGPVVGCAIGYLIGFPAWLILLVVLISDYLALGTWAYLLLEVYTRTAAFGAWAPALIIGIVILFIIATYALRKHKIKKMPTA